MAIFWSSGYTYLRNGGFAVPLASLGEVDVASGLDTGALKVEAEGTLGAPAFLSEVAPMDRHSK